MAREVTEKDFRQPEYRDAKVEDYEFRSDGALVRKDRWETAIQSIRSIVGIDCREFEITDVVDAVRKLSVELEKENEWNDITGESEYCEYPESPEQANELKLNDGSILKECCYDSSNDFWFMNSLNIKVPTHKIIAWRVQEF